MLLTSTSDIIRIVTSSTADIHAQTSWADITTTTFTPGRTNTIITSATTTTIVASPTASTQRQVKTIVLYNAHASTTNNITIQHYDGTTSNTVYYHILLAGESLEYNGQQWARYDSSGTIVSTSTLPATMTSAQLAAALTDETGSGSAVFGTGPTLVAPILGAATATSLTFNPTTGGVVGTTTNNNVTAGSVGEVVSSQILFANAVSFSNAVSKDLTSISLTAGDWDVFANFFANPTGLIGQCYGWTSTTSATLPELSTASLLNGYNNAANQALPVPTLRYSLSGTTTIYLSLNIAFTTGTVGACGFIIARRRR